VSTLFVTGAGGYLGRRFLERIPPGRFRKIVCLVRRRPECASRADLEFVRGDLLDTPAYAAALSSCDTVLHLAAVTGKARPEDYFRVNRDGTRALVEQCRRSGIGRFLHVSTIAAKFSDQSRYYYAQSKSQAEQIVRSSGLRCIILRPTMIIGPGSPLLEGLARLAAAPLLPLPGDGRARVQPIHVDDLADAILALLETGAFEGQTLEAGGSEILSIEEFLRRIARARGRQARVLHVPARVVIPLIGWIEKLLPFLPVTAGQLTSLTSNGTVEGDSLPPAPRAARDLDEALRLTPCL